MDSAAWEAKAYEQIGRILVAWGRFDHCVVSQTWKRNNPTSPFPSGPVERTFYKRWCEWCKVREPLCTQSGRSAFNQLRHDVLALSEFRDDLAHSVTRVSAINGDFTITVTHWPKTDWRTRFDSWAAKYAHMPVKVRPLPPQGGTTHRFYGTAETALALAAILDAEQRIKLIGEATSRSEQFCPPSTRLALPKSEGRFQ